MSNNFKKNTNIQNELNDNLLFNISSIISFKEIKVLKDNFSLEKEEIIEKVSEDKVGKENFLKEIIKPRKRYKEYIPKVSLYELEKLYNNYINSKIKNEDTVKSNMCQNSTKNTDFTYSGLISANQNYLGFKKIDFNEYKTKHLKLKKKSISTILEHLKEIELKKGSNQFLKPYYFFPRKYNEKNMISQLKHWTSSAYNYNKNDKSLIIHLDLYVTKILESFFNIQSIGRKNIWNRGLLVKGFKTEMNKVLVQSIVYTFENTNSRTNKYLKDLLELPSTYLKSFWYNKQVQWLTLMKKMIKSNETESGLLSKKVSRLINKNRVLLSKPLFKHTSYNLVIDLFIFKSKRAKYKKLRNILFIRSIYKYMYSMYANYPLKIKETLNRPRLFYLNLIEPKISYYYREIVNQYIDLLSLYKKKNFLIFNLLILLLRDVKSKIFRSDKLSKMNVDENSVYDLSLNEINPSNIKDKRKIIEINLDKDLKKKKFSRTKSRYILIKNYFQELNRKSQTPLDLNLLTLWSKEGLNEVSEDKNKNKTIRTRKFGSNKFSYIQYKRMNMYAEKRGRKVSKKLLKKRLMNFFLYSHTQKQNTQPKKVEIPQKKNYPNNIHNLSNSNKYNRNLLQNIKSISREKEINKSNILINNIKLELNNSNNASIIMKNQNNFNKINNTEALNFLSYSQNVTNFYLKDTRFIRNEVINKNIKFNANDKLVKNYTLRRYLEDRWLKDKLKLKNNKSFHLSSNNMRYENINNKSKHLWNILNSSLFNIVLNILDMNNEMKKQREKIDYIKILPSFNTSEKFEKIIGNIINRSSKEDIWSLIYGLGYLKSEFYKINRDVLISEKKLVLGDESDNLCDSYYFIENYGNINDDTRTKNIVTLVSGNGKNIEQKKEENLYYPEISFWKREIPNKRTNNLEYKLGYNGDIFRPYYRYMVPLLIVKTYNTFMTNLGYKKYLKLSNSSSKYDEGMIRNNVYVLFNIVVVKILLDLFNYSYRSLIRTNSNLYFLDKVKYYIGKLKRITYLNWSNTIKRIRSLRKTTNYVMFKYNSLARSFYKQVEYNTGLVTKRDILRPFVFYLEDLLFTIYGKWVIIRIWPLRKFILSSYILTKRIALLIQWRGIFSSNNNMYKILMLRLISIIKWHYLRKGYDGYLNNSRKWPSKLLENFKEKKGLNYTNLEYYDNKQERNYLFNSYVLSTKYSNPLKYLDAKLENFKLIYYNRKDFAFEKKKREFTNIFNNLYLGIINNSDISGIRFKIEGRTQFSRSNQRSYYKSSVYGTLGTLKYYSKKLLKPVAPFIPLNRGYVKSNVDSNLRVITTKNGNMSVKVWIVSYMSADIEELLLHLVRIKELYLVLSIKNIKFINHNILELRKW
jgi:hypothetical protein